MAHMKGPQSRTAKCARCQHMKAEHRPWIGCIGYELAKDAAHPNGKIPCDCPAYRPVKEEAASV